MRINIKRLLTTSPTTSAELITALATSQVPPSARQKILSLRTAHQPIIITSEFLPPSPSSNTPLSSAISNYLTRHRLPHDAIDAQALPSQEKSWEWYYSPLAWDYHLPHSGSLYQYLYQQNHSHPAGIALEFAGHTVTHRQFFTHINQVAAALLQIGVRVGDTVTVCAPSCPQSLYSYLALNKIGAVINGINARFSPQEMITAINERSSRVLILCANADQGYRQLQTIISQLHLTHVIMFHLDSKLALPTPPTTHPRYLAWSDFLALGNTVTHVPTHTDVNALAMSAHTSGTAGTRKTSLLTNRNLIATLVKSRPLYPTSVRGKKFLNVLHIDVVASFLSCICRALSLGETIILQPDTSTAWRDFPQLLFQHRPYEVMAPSIFWQRLYHYLHDLPATSHVDLSFLVIAISIGNYLPAHFQRQFNALMERFGGPHPLLEAYGTTETAAGLVSIDRSQAKVGALGIPLAGVNLQVIDPTARTEVPAGVIGKLTFASDTTMTGYQDSSLNANIFRLDSATKLRYYDTGDYGYVDHDGFLFYTEREKRVFNLNGDKVYPLRAETLFLRHPLVKNCVLLAVNQSHDQLVVVVFLVVPASTPSAKLPQLVAELTAQCRQQLAAQYLPHFFLISRSPLPQTHTCKPALTKLKHLAQQFITHQHLPSGMQSFATDLTI
jgi:long-chain acyl-CoA synthetase